MTMNSHATDDAEEAAHRGRLRRRSSGRRSRRSSGPSAGRSARRRTRPRRRRCAPRSRATRPISTCCSTRQQRRRPSRARSPASAAATPARRTRSGTRARCARASARCAAPSTGSALNSASTRRNGHSSGVTQAEDLRLGEGEHRARARRQPTTRGIDCSVRCRYSTSVVSIHGPAIAEHRDGGDDLRHERQRRLVDLRRRLEDADDAGRPTSTVEQHRRRRPSAAGTGPAGRG